jgi:hypothetical protein
MKKLNGALVLSLSLLLISGCRSAGETRDTGDASTPSSDSGAGQSAPPGEALWKTREKLEKPEEAGTSPTGPGSEKGLTADKTSAGGSAAAPLSDAERQAQESCLDKWLTGKKMDRYGHPEGTMYAGGSPIFNERTGESRDRLEYVYERLPEARKACATTATTK